MFNICTLISIHLMLLFNLRNWQETSSCMGISIHLMLLFNPLSAYQYIYHLDFNTSNVTIQLFTCSTSISFYTHFNTSNVTIQQVFPLLRSRLLFISIHLMLLFNCCTIVLRHDAVFISIHLMLLFNCICC